MQYSLIYSDVSCFLLVQKIRSAISGYDEVNYQFRDGHRSNESGAIAKLESRQAKSCYYDLNI